MKRTSRLLMRSSLLIMFTAIALTLPACALGQAPPVKAPSVKAPAIKVGDSLKITVRKESDLSGTFKVKQAGEILFPLLGRVRVAGMNAQQVSKLLTKELGRDYLRSPEVAVKLILKPK